MKIVCCFLLPVELGEEEGSPRRCGGQGDLLSGTLAVFFYWAERLVF